jgi:hypothetical protein
LLLQNFQEFFSFNFLLFPPAQLRGGASQTFFIHTFHFSGFSGFFAFSKMPLTPTKPLIQQLRENRLFTGFDQRFGS